MLRDLLRNSTGSEVPKEYIDKINLETKKESQRNRVSTLGFKKSLNVYLDFISEILQKSSGFFEDTVSNKRDLLSARFSSMGTYNVPIRKFYRFSLRGVDGGYNYFRAIKDFLEPHKDKCTMSFNIRCEPLDIDLDNKFYLGLESAKSKYEEVLAISKTLKENEFEGKGVYRVLSTGERVTINKTFLDLCYLNWQSYEEIKTAKRNGEQFSSVVILLTIDFKKRKHIKEVQETIAFMARELNVDFKEVYSNIKTYLEQNSFLNTGKMQGFIGDPVLASTTNLLRFLPREEGLLSRGGVLVGKSVESGLPVLLPVHGIRKGSSGLISAKNGEGKTMLILHLITGLLEEDVFCSVLDFKDNEYNLRDLEGYTSSKIDLGKGNYMGFFRIPNLKGIDGYALAIECSEKLLQLLTNTEDIKDLLLLKSIVKDVYKHVGVIEGISSTYSKADDVDFSLFLEFTKSKLSISQGRDSIFLSELESILDSIVTDGVLNSMMRNELFIEDIVKGDSVVFALNKTSGLSEGSLDLEDKLRLFTIKTANNIIARYNAAIGRRTFIFYEEIAKLSTSEKDLILLQDIVTSVTVLRSFGVSTYMITNSISVLEAPVFKPILTNLSVLLSSFLEYPDFLLMKKLFPKKLFIEKLQAIIEDRETLGIYENGFAYYTDISGTPISSIVRVDVPAHIRDSEYYTPPGLVANRGEVNKHEI